jgi:hypothetical protein
MARKATHYGECQVCGSRQKLPGGLVAQHGYTLEYGFFNGVCWGSKKLPYEVTCEDLKPAREHAIARAAELRDRAEQLRAADYSGTNKAWVHVYRSPSWDRGNRHGGYEWKEVELIATPKESRDGSYKWVEYSYHVEIGGKTVGNRIDLYGVDKDDKAAVIRHLNGKFGENHDKLALQADQYVKWAQDRIDGWKPVELTPVAA